MATHLLTILFVFTIGFNSQSQTVIDTVSFQMSPTFEKFTISIKTQRTSFEGCSLLITNSNGEIIKSVKLSKKKSSIESSISIQDIAMGDYTYEVSCGGKKIHEGKFIKDVYDTY